MSTYPAWSLKMKICNFFASTLLFVSGLNTSFAVQLDKLLPDERNTIEIFQEAAPKVVYVHRLARVKTNNYQKAQVSDGAGSGIIWDSLGHVVTNFHVINGADDLAITLGHMTVKAKVIGSEPRKDIAV